MQNNKNKIYMLITKEEEWQQIQLTWCQMNLTPERDNQTRE